MESNLFNRLRRELASSLVTLLCLASYGFSQSISISHTHTEPLGTSQIIRGTATGCEGLNTLTTLYYGFADGFDDAGQWQHSFSKHQFVGTNGEFQIIVPDLSRSSQYYYRCHVSNSVGSAWANVSGKFSNVPGYTQAQTDAMADAAHQAWVDSVWQSETSRAGRIGLREGFVGENWNVNTTGKWMQIYNGEILDPPLEFNVSEPFVYNNVTASNALRSLLHATYMMDYEGLNSLTDDNRIKERNEWYLQPTNIITRIHEATFPGLIGATHVAVLLVGHLQWEGDEYVYYLFRGSHPESPRNKQYIFSSKSFRKDPTNNCYWQTEDLRVSSIDSFLTIGTPHEPISCKHFGTYQEMYDYYKDSDVPAHFYTFGE